MTESDLRLTITADWSATAAALQRAALASAFPIAVVVSSSGDGDSWRMEEGCWRTVDTDGYRACGAPAADGLGLCRTHTAALREETT